MLHTIRKNHIGYFAILLITFICFFLIGKVVFMTYNSAEETFGFAEVMQTLSHGLSMDASTAGYMVIIPWLLIIASIWWKKMPFKKILIPYFIVVAIIIGLIITADTVMYSFWKFKINADIFSYAKNAEGAANSVSIWFIVSRVTSGILVIIAMAWILIRITPTRLAETVHRRILTAVMLFIGALSFVMIRGGITTSCMNVGVAYYSPKLFLNHSAVNPVFSFFKSISRSQNFAEDFNYFEEAERKSTFDGLYPESTDDLTDSLLNNKRPNILIVFMESYGGKFIEELGGVPNVSPNYSRLIKEGIFFDNYYANSFRTDRATVCNFSGFVSYPTASLMRLPNHNGHLPAIAKTLGKAGYSTTYLYGGDINIMGKKGYLISAGYNKLLSDQDFSFAQAHSSKWGVDDSITANRTYDYLMSLPKDKPWHMVFQTLSSHEPFEVPYNRLQDKVLNAFAFTDQCVGKLVDRLKASPLWDNTLIILMPDHGYLYKISYNDEAFFHCPMLWLGGAIKQPRTIHTLMNQSDFAATLLAQLGLPHDDFKWSRNVFSKNYTYPFAYSTYPSGIMFKDSTGVTMYDIVANKVVEDKPQKSDIRLKRAKAILQTSYDLLEKQR